MWHSSMSCHRALVRNDCEKPHMGFLPRASGPFLSSDLDLGYSVSLSTAHLTHCSQRQLCSPPSGTVGTLGEVPARSPLPQPCCALTVSNIPSGVPQSWKPQKTCVLLFTQHTEQVFPLSFNAPVPVTTGWWLEARAASTEDTSYRGVLDCLDCPATPTSHRPRVH